MKSSLPDRHLLRQYLLGKLDDKKELEGDLSEGILFNDDISEMADSIEDEIIEEYLDGTLDSADKNAVDEYFLQPPQRREKLHFARLLHQHFETDRDDLVAPRTDIPVGTGPYLIPEGVEVRAAILGRSHFRTYGQFAALILLAVLSLIYISGLRKDRARLENELVLERERSEGLVQEAQLSQPSMVPLTLVSDRSRGAAQIPSVEIKPSTQRIAVEVALPGGASDSYDVRLESKAGKGPLWSSRLLPLVSPAGDARLVFDVPAQRLESDVYTFVVSSSRPGPGGPKHYDFQIKLTK